MDMLEVVARSHGGRGMQLLGVKFGLTERQTRAAVDQLAPTIMAGIRRQIRSGPDGVSGLLSALAKGNHGRYLDSDDGIIDDGNAILGHVFGSKDVSRGVADKAAAASGVSPAVLRKMLPVVSAMVMGALSQQVLGDRVATGAPARGQTPRARAGRPSRSTRPTRSSPSEADSEPQTAQAAPAAATPEAGGLGGLLGQLLGGGGSNTGGSQSGGGLGGLLGQLVGGGGSGSGTGQGTGGGLGDLLGQLVGGGSGGGSAGSSGGGGLGDILQGLFGSDAKPEVRSQATQSIGGLLSGLLGGGTSSGDDADRLLDSLTSSRTGR